MHAAEQSGARDASQNVTELTRRCVAMAKQQGITEEAMLDKVGDLAEYLHGKLAEVNQTEHDRNE